MRVAALDMGANWGWWGAAGLGTAVVQAASLVLDKVGQ